MHSESSLNEDTFEEGNSSPLLCPIGMAEPAHREAERVPVNRYHSDEEIAAMLVAECGNISIAARKLEYNRSALKKRIDTSEYLLALVTEIRESIVDAAETNIYQDVLKGDQYASRFVLSTIGKDRGYVTRQENTGKDGKPVFDGMADELARIFDRITTEG